MARGSCASYHADSDPLGALLCGVHCQYDAPIACPPAHTASIHGHAARAHALLLPYRHASILPPPRPLQCFPRCSASAECCLDLSTRRHQLTRFRTRPRHGHIQSPHGLHGTATRPFSYLTQLTRANGSKPHRACRPHAHLARVDQATYSPASLTRHDLQRGYSEARGLRSPYWGIYPVC